MDVWSLMWQMVFGAVGFGYFIYGKKQQKGIPLTCGIALCVVPYFVVNTFALVAIGLALMGAPFLPASR
ncbi:MAG: hypothetical protein OEW11_02435 [Nitrospirota bacterium]|nr:hypothetical protein [Nitrospirota bacterium]